MRIFIGFQTGFCFEFDGSVRVTTEYESFDREITKNGRLLLNQFNDFGRFCARK